MHSVDIYRGTDLFVTVLPSSNSYQSKTVMGENALQLEFKSTAYLDFKLGDWCEVYGERYQLYQLPVYNKLSKVEHEYTAKFLAEGNDIAKVLYLFLGADNTLKEPSFSLVRDAEGFMDLLHMNLERIYPGRFTIGQVAPSSVKNLTFTAENCAQALSKIAEAFSSEWAVEGTTIHLTRRSQDTGLLLRHGQGKGLYEIQRNNLDTSSVITRLYPFGSEKNLPPTYGSSRLRLSTLNPQAISNLSCTVSDRGDGRSVYNFTFDPPVDGSVNSVTIKFRLSGTTDPWRQTTVSVIGGVSLLLPAGTYNFIFTTSAGVVSPVVTIGATTTTPLLTSFPFPYIENNVPIYGLIEYTQIFDDIYPHRTGTVTAVDAGNVYKFKDSSMDFDLNDQLLPGLTPKVTFNTGQLSGWSFEVSRYDHATKEFTILKNKQEAALDVPSALLKPAIGDRYVIVDMLMPDVYIREAENELLRRGQELLLLNGTPQVAYSVQLDPVWMRTNQKRLRVGDEVWIQDDDLGLNRKIRVVTLKRELLEEDAYEVQLSDKVETGTISQIINVQNATAQGLNNLQGQVTGSAVMNGRLIGDTRVEQGTLIFDANMPTIPAATADHKAVYIDETTGKLVRIV